MSKLSKLLIATAIAAVALPASSAMAAVTGSSGGSFSSLSSCTTTTTGNFFTGFTFKDCAITDTVANGSNTEVEWGPSNFIGSFSNPSTLTAVDVAIGSFTTAQTNVKIAELTWTNTAISDPNDDLGSLGVDYTLSFLFTAPGGSSGAPEQFDLTIVNPTNPPGDKISSFTVGDLNALSFTIPGWTVSGLQYVVDGGTTFGGACGADTWCNPENNTGNLYIEANFTPTVTGVPEPMTLSLFGAGLAGAAAFGMRRRKKV